MLVQNRRDVKSEIIHKVVFSFFRYMSKTIQDIKKYFVQKFYNKITSIYSRQ